MQSSIQLDCTAITPLDSTLTYTTSVCREMNQRHENEVGSLHLQTRSSFLLALTKGDTVVFPCVRAISRLLLFFWLQIKIISSLSLVLVNTKVDSSLDMKQQINTHENENIVCFTHACVTTNLSSRNGHLCKTVAPHQRANDAMLIAAGVFAKFSAEPLFAFDLNAGLPKPVLTRDKPWKKNVLFRKRLFLSYQMHVHELWNLNIGSCINLIA